MSELAIEKQAVDYAKDRMIEWADWMRALEGVGIGFSSRAAFLADAPEDGLDRIGLDAAGMTRAEEVEAVMCKMRKVRPTLYKASSLYYLAEVPQVAAAKRLRCSERVFRDQLRMSEMFVAGGLDW